MDDEMPSSIASLSHTMNLAIGLRKSTLPQNRRLHNLISNSKHEVDCGGVDFLKPFN